MYVGYLTRGSNDGGAEITDYKIYRGSSAEAMIFLKSTGSTLTSFKDLTAENGVTYYCISAVNAIGGGERCQAVSVTPEAGERDYVDYDNVDGTDTTYHDGTVVNGITYYYRVTAINSKGIGAQSND